MLLFPPGMAGLSLGARNGQWTAEHVPDELDRRSGQSYSGRWLVPSRRRLLLLLVVLPIFLILNAFCEIHITASRASRRWLQLYGR